MTGEAEASEANETASSSATSRLVILIVAILPVALLVAVLRSGVITDGDQPAYDLAGAWEVHEGNESSLALIGDDDSIAAWRPIVLPAPYSRNGFTGPDAWLRRNFDVPPQLLGRPAVIAIGSATSGTYDVFLNGQLLGHSQPGPGPNRAEHLGVEMFPVHADLLRPTQNLLAFKVHWHILGLDGFVGEMLLGSAEGITPVVLRGVSVRNSMYAAALGALLILGVLLIFLLGSERGGAQSGMYLATLGLIVATANYVLVTTLPLVTIHRLYAAAIPASMAALAGVSFFASYQLAGTPRRLSILTGKGNALGTALGLVLFPWPASKVAQIYAANVAPAIEGSSCFLLLAIGLYMLLTRRRALDRVAGLAVLWAIGAGLVDVTRQFGITTGPLLFVVVGAPSTALLAVIVVFSDFANVAFRNKRLTVSLGQINTELKTALDKAQEASRLKSEFVATVSHELRTPLNSIINVPEGLLERFAEVRGATCAGCSSAFELEPTETVDPQAPCPACGVVGRIQEAKSCRYRGDLSVVAENLGRVTNAGKGLLALINDVLDFSKLEAGKMELHLSKVSLQPLVKDVVDLLQPVATKARVTIRVGASTSDTPVVVDPVKLTQVLINLLGNAVKFSTPGAEVLVMTSMDDHVCQLSVRDSGIGIAPENHATIFESFRQVDGTSTRRFGGTGLGLAIARKYVELHGGTLRVDSALGKGSTFQVTLPIHAGEWVSPSGQCEKSPALDVTALILDDEPFAIENLKMSLVPLGCHVVGVRDPRSLETALAEHRPDILFIDVVLPYLSGLEVLRELSARPNMPPIVITSAHPNNAEIARSMGAEWLEKPWRASTLQALVLRLCKSAPASPGVTQATG